VIFSRKLVDAASQSMFHKKHSEKVFDVRARLRAGVRHKGVRRVEMTRWYAEKPQGLIGSGAPALACSLGVSESVKSLLAGFGHGRVRVHQIPMTANDGAARPMGTPGGSTG
jgi:hypothetical protein